MKSNDLDIAYGTRAVIEAIKSGKAIERLLIQKGLSNSLISELRSEIKGQDIPISYVPLEKLNRIKKGNHQGVIAYLSVIDYPKLENIVMQVFESGKTPFFLILDRITDVRNFGAIARTAECAGVQAIIVPDKGSALITSDAIKTSAGALHHIHVCKEKSLKNTIHYLKDSGIEVIACTEKTEDTVFEADFVSPTCVVLGSEENGISEDILAACDQKVKIPMSGKIDSLNVSVAAGIVLFQISAKNKSLIT